MSASAELAAKFDRLVAVIPDANRAAVEQSAQFAKGEFLAAAVRAGLRPGGPLPRRSGARWGVRYSIVGARNPSALVRFVGPVHWAFYGTDDHYVFAGQFGRVGGKAGARVRGRLGAASAFGGAADSGLGVLAARTAKADARRAAAGRRVRSRKKALTTPHGPRAWAFVGGSKGNNQFPAARARVAERSPVVFADAHRNAIVRAGFGR